MTILISMCKNSEKFEFNDDNISVKKFINFGE